MMAKLCLMCNSNLPVGSLELCLKCAGYNATRTLKDFEHIMRQDHPELPAFHIEFLANFAHRDSQRIYQVARLTAENERLRAFVEDVRNNAPVDEQEPEELWRWVMWEAGIKARALLASLQQPESEGA